MIDAYDVTKFDRTPAELEEYFLFCVAVAGKKATVVASKLDDFLSGAMPGESPFAYVRRLQGEGRLLERLVEVRMGKYSLLCRAWAAAALLPDLASATVDELEALPGVGQKTARFFVLHTRKDAKVAVIDTHVLKFLRHRGHRVPKGFPGPREYVRLEAIMLDEVAASGMEPADFDLAVWAHYASNGASPLPGLAA